MKMHSWLWKPQSLFVQFLSRCDQLYVLFGGDQMKSLDEADVDQDPANGRGFWRAASKVT